MKMINVINKVNFGFVVDKLQSSIAAEAMQRLSRKL